MSYSELPPLIKDTIENITNRYNNEIINCSIAIIANIEIAALFSLLTVVEVYQAYHSGTDLITGYNGILISIDNNESYFRVGFIEE